MWQIHPTAIIINSTIAENVNIGPWSYISDSQIQADVSIEGGVRIEKSMIDEGSEILWWAIIRDSHIHSSCIIGAEIKKSEIGKNNKAKHPGTSITNTISGENVNFWGGCRFANYDGKGKGNFIIGDHVFIWCNAVISAKANTTTSLGERTKIGASVHVSGEIPAWSLVYTDRETGKLTIREHYYPYYPL